MGPSITAKYENCVEVSIQDMRVPLLATTHVSDRQLQ